jgi:hypothetical protein
MIVKKYFSLKYNTIYCPFKQDGTEDATRTINKQMNFGGEKRIDIGGGRTGDDPFVQTTYGLYCKARGLIGFDTNDFTDSSITGKNLQANVRLYHMTPAPTTYTIPSLTVELYPLTAE